MIDFLRSAFRNLGRKRIRTVLTMAGIAIGVASVIIIGSISQCGTNALSNELESLGLSGLTISASPQAQGARLGMDELKLVRKCEQVEQAAPIVMLTTEIQTKRYQTKALVWGIDTRASQIVSINVLLGRMFDSKDVSTGANVCLVDENFARNAYSRDNMIGKTIQVQCGDSLEPFEVIGMIKTGSGLLQNFIGDYIPTFVYVPYTTVQTALGKSSFDQIAVKVAKGGDVDAIGKTIASTLDVADGLKDGYVASNLAKQREGLNSMLDIITLILTAVGAISLLVASLSIMTVMLVSVSERTREIGIKKAIGAGRGSIMLEFMFEALLISVLGCVTGIVVGYGLSFAGAAYLQIELGMRWDTLFLAVAFALLTGTIFGVYPAYKASSLKPVDALRME